MNCYTMKKLVLFAFLFVIGAFAAQDVMAQGKAEITFTSPKKHDFGDIKQGDRVQHTFKFKNTGDAPLVISRVQTTCGCTIAEKPKDPVPPGEESKIVAKFNSSGKVGKQNKVITIHNNSANPRERVTLVSNVLTE